jgi:hypothetical protein
MKSPTCGCRLTMTVGRLSLMLSKARKRVSDKEKPVLLSGLVDEDRFREMPDHDC